MSRPGGAGDDFARLSAASHLSVTTFRRDGQGVATPVWFVVVDGDLWARSAEDSGKVRRIHREPAVRLAPCTRDGTTTGPPVPAVAALVPRRCRPDVYRALLHRYGLAARLYDLYWTRLRGTRTLLLRFTLDGGAPPGGGPAA